MNISGSGSGTNNDLFAQLSGMS
jgi:hypothetical protein